MDRLVGGKHRNRISGAKIRTQVNRRRAPAGRRKPIRPRVTRRIQRSSSTLSINSMLRRQRRKRIISLKLPSL